VVKPFPTYISKLYGEKRGENAELHQTYDLISGVGADNREEGITYVKLMILEETCSQPEKSDQYSCCHPGCGSFRQGLDEEDLTKLSHSHLRL
jgi:hypothetical protein